MKKINNIQKLTLSSLMIFSAAQGAENADGAENKNPTVEVRDEASEESGKTHQPVQFSKIVDDFAAWERHRQEIIVHFNSVISSGELGDKEKMEAMKIAEALNAPKLKARLDAYYQKDQGGYFNTLPSEVLHFIIEKVLEGGSITGIKTLLLTSKIFHTRFLSLPVRLDFRGFEDKVNNEVLAKIVKIFPNATALKLNSIYNITDAGLESLKDLKNLISLHLTSNRNITDAGLNVLKGLTKLTSLKLGNCRNITGAVLENLKDLENFTVLMLVDNRLTDAGLENLKYLKRLTHLTVGNRDDNHITDAWLASLKDMTRLTHLSLSNFSATDGGLANLKDLKGLTFLKLMDLKITDTGLENLKDLTNLTSLELTDNPDITDIGLGNLKGLTNLTFLDLRSCSNITDAGLENLRGLTKLTSLRLWQCLGITDEGAEKLKAALPNLEVGERVHR